MSFEEIEDESNDFIDYETEELEEFKERHLYNSELASSELSSYQTHKNHKHYECLTPEMIAHQQQEALERIKIYFPHLPLSAARVLLNAYQWDAVKMLDAYAESPEKVSSQLGLAPSEQGTTQKLSTHTNENPNICDICYEICEKTDLNIFPCEHRFCSECLTSYLSYEVKEKKQFITCPGYTKNKTKCNMVVDELTVLRLLGDREGEKRFIESLRNAFVENNPSIKWCPAPECPNAILLTEISTERNESVECLCGHTFCFRCSLESHQPCSCLMFEKWKKIASGQDDRLNDAFITSVSRPCPSCKVPIEKNHGCNHMTCTKCQYHFCWQCMGKFGTGSKGGSDGYKIHECNGHYQQDSQVVSKVGELQRFQFYNTRYANHERSQDLEGKQQVESVIMSLSSRYGIGLDACQFFQNAVSQLIRNRQTLKFSYVFGFYRPLDAPYVNKCIFEDLQLQLELHTEKLSFLTKQLADLLRNESYSSNSDAVFGLKSEISHQTRVANNVLQALFDSASLWSSINESHAPACTTAYTSSSLLSNPSSSTSSSQTSTELNRPSGSLTKLNLNVAADMIPCEFCSRSVTLEQYDAHVNICAADRGTFARLTAVDGNQNQAGNLNVNTHTHAGRAGHQFQPVPNPATTVNIPPGSGKLRSKVKKKGLFQRIFGKKK
eukprot:TRINITY_DN1771_c0_g1_i1.p1 TRINITY_DN1771_c0_g1~~TRINITY_DN1771_c0_g1_i1.p1  ORF type:complete len:679 (+),score=104.89 TRINITY_DN1771_c0_g1_i1:37-2037(+)